MLIDHVDYTCLPNGNLLAVVWYTQGAELLLSVLLVNGNTSASLDQVDWKQKETFLSAVSSDGSRLVIATTNSSDESLLLLNTFVYEITWNLTLLNNSSIQLNQNVSVTSCALMIQNDQFALLLNKGEINGIFHVLLVNVSSPEEYHLRTLASNPWSSQVQSNIKCSFFPASSEPRVVIFAEGTYRNDFLQWNTKNSSTAFIRWRSPVPIEIVIGYSSPDTFQTTGCDPFTDMMDCSLNWYRAFGNYVSSFRTTEVALQPYELKQMIPTDSDLV